MKIAIRKDIVSTQNGRCFEGRTMKPYNAVLD